MLTDRNRRQSSPLCELVGSEDPDKDREGHDADPPPGDVPDQVHLLAVLVLARPETDPAQQERPVDRTRCVRVRVGQARVVLEHGDLQFKEFAQERHFRRLAGFLLRSMNVRHV